VVPTAYAGWLRPDRDEIELLLAVGCAGAARLPGWVRDALSDEIVTLSRTHQAGSLRDALNELARYYLRPIAPRLLEDNREKRRRRRAQAADYLAERLLRPAINPVELRLQGIPLKNERISPDSLARDPAFRWLTHLDGFYRDLEIARALRQATDEAERRITSDADAMIATGVLVVAAVLHVGEAPETDFDGTSLVGMATRKNTRSRQALPLVLMCVHRVALETFRWKRLAAEPVGMAALRLSAPPFGRSVLRPRDEHLEPASLPAELAAAWSRISSGGSRETLDRLGRLAVLGRQEAPSVVTDAVLRELQLLTLAIARRHSDIRALDIRVGPPAAYDSADAVLFALNYKRESLLLRSHHSADADWNAEIIKMEGHLATYGRLLPGLEKRRQEKVRMHLHQALLLRRARELVTAGQPLDTVQGPMADGVLDQTVAILNDLVASLERSFKAAHDDHDPLARLNAHRRKTEAMGVVHLLGRIADSEAATAAEILERSFGRFEDVGLEEHSDVRAEARAIWLLAVADRAVREDQPGRARRYLAAAEVVIPEGIPHLTIRAADVAAGIGDTALTARIIARLPEGQPWPRHLRLLEERIRSYIDGLASH
jgi:hypothetical protein